MTATPTFPMEGPRTPLCLSVRTLSITRLVSDALDLLDMVVWKTSNGMPEAVSGSDGARKKNECREQTKGVMGEGESIPTDTIKVVSLWFHLPAQRIDTVRAKLQ